MLVLTVDRKLRALTTRDLGPAGAWDLSAAPVVGPVESGGMFFVGDAAGKVVAFDEGARRMWEIVLPDGSILAGAPAVVGEEVWLTTASGNLARVERSSGAVLEQRRLDIRPVDGPIVSGGGLYLPTAPGTLHLVPRSGGEPTPGQAGN
jgi:outer membrane protein assembly factor BamB